MRGERNAPAVKRRAQGAIGKQAIDTELRKHLGLIKPDPATAPVAAEAAAPASPPKPAPARR